MKIGLVYDLKDEYRGLGLDEEALAEFDSAETIDELAAALTGLGHQLERIGGTKALARALGEGARFDLVFSIAEGLKGRSREALAPAVCELFDQPYCFSDPLTMALCLDKAMAKRIVRDAGLNTAAFALMQGASDQAPGFAFPMFVKPVSEGTGKGCRATSRVNSEPALREEVARIVKDFSQPALVEQFLPGREFTVGVLGEGADASVLGVLELIIAPSEAGIYHYANKQSFGDHFDCRLADDPEAQRAASLALEAYRALGCRDVARIDVRADAHGAPMFLEANPIPGLKPGFSDLCLLAEMAGKSYGWLINAIVENAERRIHGARTEPGSARNR